MMRQVRIYSALLLVVTTLLLTACGGDSVNSTTAIVPVANAGSNQSVPDGAVVTLDGGASTPSSALTYAWSFTTRPAGSIAALSDVGAIHPTFTADVAGTYILQLIVRNGTAASAPATVTITANITTTTHELVANGSFESGLLGWSWGVNSEVGATGTCSYNAALAPGAETLTSVAGFPATDGTHTVLGSVSSTSGTASSYSCVLYQDISIPAFTTDLVLQFDIAATAGNNGCIDTGAFIGLYLTTAVPGTTSTLLGGTATSVCTNVPGTSLATMTKTLNASAVAGTTVRLSFINTAGDSGGEVIGVDNVRLMATVTH
jgi:hypothetical protein